MCWQPFVNSNESNFCIVYYYHTVYDSISSEKTLTSIFHSCPHTPSMVLKSFESIRKLPSWHIRISPSMNEGLRCTWICIVWMYSRNRLTRYWVCTSPISQFWSCEIAKWHCREMNEMSDRQSLFCLDINIEIIIEYHTVITGGLQWKRIFNVKHDSKSLHLTYGR